MRDALGMVEYSTVTAGIVASDLLAKTANITIVRAEAVCPGKFITSFTGELGAVRASLDAAKRNFPDRLIDDFLLGNPHEQLILALSGAGERVFSGSIGIVETVTASSIIVSADAGAKAAGIHIAHIRIAHQLCGKSYALFTGSIAEIEEAVSHAKNAAGLMLLDSAVIASPEENFIRTF